MEWIDVAPEATEDVTEEERVLARPCDVYSAGVCLYHMLVGQIPFNTYTCEGNDLSPLSQRIRQGDLRFDNQTLWARVSDEAMHLVARMMDPDPYNRPTAEQVLQHPWMIANFPINHSLDFTNLRAPHRPDGRAFASRSPEWVTSSISAMLVDALNGKDFLHGTAR